MQKSKKKRENEPVWAHQLIEKITPHEPPSPISLSMIIPVFNSSESIGMTLDSLKKQNYPNLEVIIVDAGSTDKTLEIVHSFHDFISRVYTVATYNLFEMLNRGVALATGEYISFLFPGSFYLSNQALMLMADKANQEKFPDLLYASSIQREGKRDPKTFSHFLNKKLLEKGVQPTALSACWFRSSLMERVGKFKTKYSLRSGLDFFCRIPLGDRKILKVDKVIVDFDFGPLTFKKWGIYVKETVEILKEHFGWRKALGWLFGFNQLRILFWWLRRLRVK